MVATTQCAVVRVWVTGFRPTGLPPEFTSVGKPRSVHVRQLSWTHRGLRDFGSEQCSTYDRSFDTLAWRARLPISSACEPHATCECLLSQQCPAALSENRMSEQYMFPSASHSQSVWKPQHVRRSIVLACFKQRVDDFMTMPSTCFG